MKNIFFLSVLMMLAIVACSDNESPDNNDNRCYYDSILDINGFIFSGAGYSETVVDFSALGSCNYDTELTQIIITESVCLSKTKKEKFVLRIIFPGQARGEFEWEDLIENPSNESYVNISIGDKDFVSVEGATTVQFYKDNGTNYVAGTFSGALADGFGNTITVSTGRFKVQ